MFPTTAKAGWEMAAACDYDLIILDLMLPGLGGTEILKRIRRHGSKMPILILTARADTAEKVANFEAGADDYLTKPFAFDELLVRVKALLRRGAADRSTCCGSATWKLIAPASRCRRAGKKIELTSKEYGLLEYLAANAGRVLSRTMIIEHVWDESFEGLTNIVDVYVRHLRSKVDDQHPQKLIRTVRGVGYCHERRGRDMNPRSIRFRLIIWYAGLLTGAFLLFGVALYQVLRGYLENSLAQTLIRRSEQIARIAPGRHRQNRGALCGGPNCGSLCAGELRSVYSHHARRMEACFTLRAGRRVLIPPDCVRWTSTLSKSDFVHKVLLGDGNLLAGTVERFEASDGHRFLIESGGPMAPIETMLSHLLFSLLLGVPLLGFGGGGRRPFPGGPRAGASGANCAKRRTNHPA